MLFCCAGAASLQQGPPGPPPDADAGSAEGNGFDDGMDHDMGDDQVYSDAGGEGASDEAAEGDGADGVEQEEEYNVSGMGGL